MSGRICMRKETSNELVLKVKSARIGGIRRVDRSLNTFNVFFKIPLETSNNPQLSDINFINVTVAKSFLYFSQLINFPQFF